MRLLGLIFVGLLALSGPTFGQETVGGAFTHVPLHAGVIRPSGLDQQTLDRQLVDFYAAWKSVYLKRGCGDGRVYVATSGDGKPTWGGSAEHSITVSEAHGYGMLALVMLADADPEAKDLFDGMVRFFLDHPATSDPGLMAWNQVEGCDNGAEVVGGSNSATDGDLDIAYALLLADSKWGSTGAFDYRALAQRTLDAILAHDVAGQGDFVQIGDWVETGDDATYAFTTRTSDFMLSHFRAFAEATGNDRWLRVRDETYDIVASIVQRFSPGRGLAPDFVVGLPDHPQPAPSGFLEGEFDGDYSWNAARYPWRVGLDYLLYGEKRAYEALAPLNAFIQTSTCGDPTEIASTYLLDGRIPPDQSRNPMAFVSMFAVGAMIDRKNQKWLDALWSDMLDSDLSDEDYFGNTLKLMAMIAVTGHWSKPDGDEGF